MERDKDLNNKMIVFFFQSTLNSRVYDASKIISPLNFLYIDGTSHLKLHIGMISLGGPLIIMGDTPDDDIEVGIVSWGSGCGSSPAVYARVSRAYDWIVENVCGDDKSDGESNDPPQGLCGVPTDSPSMDPTRGPTGNPTRS